MSDKSVAGYIKNILNYYRHLAEEGINYSSNYQ